MHSTRLLAEDVVLVGLDPARGKVRLGRFADVLVDGAIVIDLVRAGRVVVSGTGTDTRVAVADARPVEHPVLRGALRWLDKVHGPPTATDLAELGAAGWLTRKIVGLAWDPTKPGAKLSGALSGHFACRRVTEYLVASGALTAHEHRTFGIRPTQRYAATPLAERDQLVEALRAVLLDGHEPDQRTGPLIGLLGAASLFQDTWNGAAHLTRWAPRARRREVHERSQELARTERDVEGVGAVLTACKAIIVKRNQTSS